MVLLQFIMAFAFKHLWRGPGVLVTLSLLCKGDLKKTGFIVAHNPGDGSTSCKTHTSRSLSQLTVGHMTSTVKPEPQEHAATQSRPIQYRCHPRNGPIYSGKVFLPHAIMIIPQQQDQKLTFLVILGSVTLTGTNHHPW